MPRLVECKSVKSLSIDNASLMNAAYSIPCEIPGSQGHLQPTESQFQLFNQSWPIAAGNQVHEQKVDNDGIKVISVPQGAYYDVPIIIDPVNYQQQQDNSFNVSPQQLQNLPIAQIPCTNANCVHCKSPNAS